MVAKVKIQQGVKAKMFDHIKRLVVNHIKDRMVNHIKKMDDQPHQRTKQEVGRPALSHERGSRLSKFSIRNDNEGDSNMANGFSFKGGVWHEIYTNLLFEKALLYFAKVCMSETYQRSTGIITRARTLNPPNTRQMLLPLSHQNNWTMQRINKYYYYKQILKFSPWPLYE